MATYMYKLVMDKTKRLIGAARFLTVTVDEVTAVDNSNFLSVHAYIVWDWIRIPLLIALQRVECSPTAENLTDLIVGSVRTGGGLDHEGVATKVLSFGTDGASVLQGNCTSVIL